jgi:hypothetical protein
MILIYHHRRCKFFVVIIDVVVPVAIHRRSLDKAIAKIHVFTQTRAALLAVHMYVAAVRTNPLACQLTRAIFPSAPPLFCHHLALVNAPWQFALLILQQRIVIHRCLHPFSSLLDTFGRNVSIVPPKGTG